MKTKPIHLIIFIFFLLSCQGRPVLHFNEVSHDFGRVKQDTALVHVFKFTNKGDRVLVITDVSAG